MTTDELLDTLINIAKTPRPIPTEERDTLCAAFLAALGRTAGRTWRLHPDVVQAMIAVLRSEPIDDLAYHIRAKEAQIVTLKAQIRELRRKQVHQ